MQCTLLVPDLLLSPPPDAAPDVTSITAFYRDLHLPALARLLARGQRRTFDALSMETWLCQAFEVERQHDWPVAPLTLVSDGGDAGDRYWLRCDPVHLRPQRSQLLLAGSDVAAPTQDEARALIAALNSHFSQDGMVFHAPRPERWYLSLARVPALATHALPDVTGKDINHYLPSGDDGLRWNQRLNEIQMLLHAHPVNEARETRNQPVINSVWLWGGGVKPTLHGRHFSCVWSDDALAIALAASSDIPTHALPDATTSLLAANSTNAEKQLVVLPQLRSAIGCGDFDRWCMEIKALEHNWFAPLLEALQRRRLAGLTLIALNARRCLRCDVTGSDLWKFWRPLQPLAHHA